MSLAQNDLMLFQFASFMGTTTKIFRTVPWSSRHKYTILLSYFFIKFKMSFSSDQYSLCNRACFGIARTNILARSFMAMSIIFFCLVALSLFIRLTYATYQRYMVSGFVSCFAMGRINLVCVQMVHKC